MKSMHGILVLNKPRGMTSHDCVHQVRTLTGIKKVGHTGTLDPQVNGVLPICIGRATKVVEYLTLDEKEYMAQITLGKTTDTEDQTGKVVEDTPLATVPERASINHILAQFKGEIEQTPPMYSAVKIRGKRLYEWAREGKVIDRPSRRVTIKELELIDVHPVLPYPSFHIRVLCSKGTYIRTLGVEIGKALGTAAHMSSLTRTQSGVFHINDSITLEEISAWDEHDWHQRLKPVDSGLSHFPELELEHDLASRLMMGQTVQAPHKVNQNQMYRVYERGGSFLAIGQGIRSQFVKPHKVIQT